MGSSQSPQRRDRNAGEASAEPKISVVIPAYNRVDLLTRAVRSVLQQTLASFEVLVVDDCSTDDLPAMVESLGDPRIRLLTHERNMGGGAARNTAMASATGEYLAFLDSDDVWVRDKLRAQLQCAETLPDAEHAILYSRTRIIRERSSTVAPDRAIRPGECVLEYMLLDGFIQTSSIFGNRAFFLDLGFDEDYRKWEDWDFVIRARRLGASFVMLEEPLVEHHAEGHPRMSSEVPPARAREWISQHRSSVSPRAARAFESSCVALEDARSGRIAPASALAIRGLLRGDLRARPFGGIMLTAARSKLSRGFGRGSATSEKEAASC